MNIKDHPDFKVTVIIDYCPDCNEYVEFNAGLMLNPSDEKSEYCECTKCGYQMY